MFKKIRTMEQYKEAQDLVDAIMNQSEVLSKGERKTIHKLISLIEEFEDDGE